MRLNADRALGQCWEMGYSGVIGMFRRRMHKPSEILCPRSVQDLFHRGLNDDPAKRPTAREASEAVGKIIEA